MPHFHIRLRHPQYGVYDLYTPMPDYFSSYESIEVLDEVRQIVVARFEKGQLMDFAGLMATLIRKLDEAAQR